MKSQWLISLSCLAIAVAGIATLTSEAQAGRISVPVRTNPGTQVPPQRPVQSIPPLKPPAMTTVRCVGKMADNHLLLHGLQVILEINILLKPDAKWFPLN
jgi:hypothetical protein